MRFFSLAIALLAGFFGINLGFRAYKKFRYLTTEGKVSIRYLVMNSIIAGGAGVLIFFSIIMAMGFVDETYIWNVDKIWGAIFVSLIPGGIITIGSFMQAIIITRYRRILIDTLKQEEMKNRSYNDAQKDEPAS
jgi:hypothetical protein